MSEGSTEQIEMMAGLDLGDKYSYLYFLEVDSGDDGETRTAGER
jgi:hypothetical protein